MPNVPVLALAQFFCAFGQVAMLILAGIIGASLGPDPTLATVPVTLGPTDMRPRVHILAPTRIEHRRPPAASAMPMPVNPLLASPRATQQQKAQELLNRMAREAAGQIGRAAKEAAKRAVRDALNRQIGRVADGIKGLASAITGATTGDGKKKPR